MPFNSSINSYHSYHESSSYIDKNRKEYNYERDDKLDTLEPVTMTYKPNPARLVTKIVTESDDEGEYLGGSKIGKWLKRNANKATKTITNATNKSIKGVKEVAYKADRDTRGLQSEFERSATKKNGLIRSIITRTLDEVPNMLGDAAAMAAVASGNPALAPAAKYATTKTTKIGRNVLKDKTGYGKKDISDIMEKYVPGYKKDVKTKSNTIPRPVGRPTSKRNELVKQIMKEQNLSMPKASKYIKENNLYHK